MNRTLKHPAIRLVAACYLLWLAGLLVFHCGLLVANRVGYATGALQTAQLTVEDFTWVNLVEKDGLLVSTSADPQLILKDGTKKVDTLLLEMEFSHPPRLVTAFWAAQGQDYTLRQMAYPASNQRGTFQFFLPATGVQNLRVDPGTVAGNQITIHSIRVNQPRPFWAFFQFSTLEWVLWLCVPGLVASGGWLGVLFLKNWQEKAKKVL